MATALNWRGPTSVVACNEDAEEQFHFVCIVTVTPTVNFHIAGKRTNVYRIDARRVFRRDNA
jgi:hypothetical protein